MPNMRTKAFSIKGIDAQHVRVESEAITTVLPTGKHLGSHSAIPLKRHLLAMTTTMVMAMASY